MEENQEKQHVEPLVVQYCGVCGVPPEFCEFGKKFKKCKVWMEKNAPEVFANLPKQSKEQEEKEAKELQKLEKKEEEKQQEEATNDEPKKKKGKKAKNTKQGENEQITVTVQKRMGKKRFTLIMGLKSYGVNLKDFAKKCSKKFASSSSVLEDKYIEIQGDVADNIEPFLLKEFATFLTSEMITFNKMDAITKKESGPKGRQAKIIKQQQDQKAEDSEEEERRIKERQDKQQDVDFGSDEEKKQEQQEDSD